MSSISRARHLTLAGAASIPSPVVTQLHTDDADNQAYYDDFSDWYERERGRDYHQMLDDLELRVCAPLAIGRHVLEVGCGTGLILSRLAQHADSAWGVDLS